MKHEYQVNEKVVTNPFEKMPLEVRTRAFGKVCGKNATIIDKLYSEGKNKYVYRLHIDGMIMPSIIDFTEDMFGPIDIEQPKEYTGDITIADNKVVIVRIYENGKMLRTGHGHIFHEGAVGVAQAISYAAKKIYQSFDENTTVIGENKYEQRN